MSIGPTRVHIGEEQFTSPEVQVEAVDSAPKPAIKPLRGWFLFAYDGQQAVRVKDDMHSPAWNYQSRTLDEGINIALTNMTYAFWYIANDLVQRSKTTVRLDLEPGWKAFFEYLLGRRNWEWICQPGVGYMDSNAENTNPDTDPLRLQSIDWGNNLRKVVPNPDISARYTQVEVFAYHSPPTYDPERDRWYVGSTPVGIDDSPQLMIVQTLVGHNGLGQSYGPIADKGEVGGAGKVITPAVMRYPAVHETAHLYFYPRTPFLAKIYAESLMVEGESVARSGGVDMIVDALCFTGFKVFGRTTQYATRFDQWLANIPILGGLARTVELWWLLEEMLMRGDINNRSLGGTWRDWRIFSDYGGNPPPCCPPQDIGWYRI